MTSTISTATGPWRTKKWRVHWDSRATTTDSNSARRTQREAWRGHPSRVPSVALAAGIDGAPQTGNQGQPRRRRSPFKVLTDGGKPGDWGWWAKAAGFTGPPAATREGTSTSATSARTPCIESGSMTRSRSPGSRRPEGERTPIRSRRTPLCGRRETPRTSGFWSSIRSKPSEVLATEVQPNDLIVSRAGFVYFTDTGAGQVVKVPISARGLPPAAVAGGINKPNGITLSPDQRMLIVSEYGGSNAWTFLIGEDGNLRGGEKNLELRTPVVEPTAEATA